MINTTGRIYDGARNNTNEPTTTVGVRVFIRQYRQIREKYTGNVSVLVRFLIDKFDSSLELQTEFDALLTSKRK